MKVLHYGTQNNLSLLHDELLTAIPGLRPTTTGELDGSGNLLRRPVMTVEGDDNNVWLTVSDDADEASITAVVRVHDHTKTQQDPRQERLGRIAQMLQVRRDDWTAAQMRELIDLVSQELAPAQILEH